VKPRRRPRPRTDPAAPPSAPRGDPAAPAHDVPVRREHMHAEPALPQEHHVEQILVVVERVVQRRMPRSVHRPPPRVRADARVLPSRQFEEAQVIGERDDVPAVHLRLVPGKQHVLHERRRLDVTPPPDAHQLPAGLDRVIDVLQHMRAIHKLERLVRKRQVVDIRLDKRPPVALQRPMPVWRLARKQIHQHRRRRERIVPATHVDDGGVGRNRKVDQRILVRPLRRGPRLVRRQMHALHPHPPPPQQPLLSSPHQARQQRRPPRDETRDRPRRGRSSSARSSPCGSSRHPRP
jgi:hypothetical protein